MGFHLSEDPFLLRVPHGFDRPAEPQRGFIGPPLYDLFQPIKGAAADKQDIGGIHLDELLLGMLAAPLRRYVGNGTLQDLQQRLLHPFPADVAGDGRGFALAGNLVNLVDIDDPPLRLGNVKIRRLQQPQQDIFHIFADIACFRQCSGVGDGKRYPQHLGQRLRQHGLSHAGGAQQQDIALAQLYIVCIPAANPLVVVVYRH